MKKALIVAVVILFVAPVCACAYSWQHASSPGIGRMAVDPSGDLWLVTKDSLSQWTGSSWQTESMPTSWDRSNPSLAFSSDGRPHIITDEFSGIAYLTKDADGWHQESVRDDMDHLAGNTNVAVGADGKVYTAVVAPVNDRYLYLMSRDTNGVWSEQVVDNMGWNTAWWPDMEIDPVSGDFVIAYTTGMSDDLKVATGKPGSWSYTNVESSMVTGWVPQLEITSDGRNVIGYGYRTIKHYGLAIQQADGTYKHAYPGTSGKFIYSLSLVNDTPLMVYTQGVEGAYKYDSKLYCSWYENGTTATEFEVGDGTVMASLVDEFYNMDISSPEPYVSSQVVGDTLYVNFINADGSGAETWYTTVPEPSSILALVTGLAGIGLLRRRRS